MAKQVMAILGSGVLGGGTGLSDADVKFAKAAAANEITMDKNAIREIMRIAEIIARTKKSNARKKMIKLGNRHGYDMADRISTFGEDDFFDPDNLPPHLQSNWEGKWDDKFTPFKNMNPYDKKKRKSGRPAPEGTTPL
jgi:hypothetical protein